MKKFTFGFLFAALLLAAVSAPAKTNSCHRIYQAAQPKHQIERDALAGFLVEKNIPAVAIPTRNGMIPAVLMNVSSGAKLRSYLSNSVGTIVSYQPQHTNDHGMIRLFHVLADFDAPGSRRAGELHQTGISWVWLDAHLKYSQGREKVKIEVVYALTPEEKTIVSLYHLMRRAAIIRVPFTFKGTRPQEGLANMLENVGEHCFLFCHGSGINSHLYGIRTKFDQYQAGSIEQVIQRPDVQNWLAAVEKALLNSKMDDPDILSPHLPIRTGVPESLEVHLAKLDEAGRSEFLNWIVGYHTSVKYSQLLKTLGIGGDNAYNGIHNPRATAIFVYDGVTMPVDFMTSEYRAQGVFSNWSHENAQKLTDVFESAKEASLKPKPTGIINKILNFFN